MGEDGGDRQGEGEGEEGPEVGGREGGRGVAVRLGTCRYGKYTSVVSLLAGRSRVTFCERARVCPD